MTGWWPMLLLVCVIALAAWGFWPLFRRNPPAPWDDEPVDVQDDKGV